MRPPLPPHASPALPPPADRSDLSDCLKNLGFHRGGYHLREGLRRRMLKLQAQVCLLGVWVWEARIW